MLNSVPSQPELTALDLTTVISGEWQVNELGECRAFLRPYEEVAEEYIGFVNARFDQKYFQLQTRLKNLVHVVRRFAAPGWVLAPWPAHDWLRLTGHHHPTMMPLIGELITMNALSRTSGRPSLWANDFICHRSVFFDWHRFWRRSFDHFTDRYGLDLPFDNRGVDESRKAAFFFERVTTAYFANRPDVRVIGLE